MSYKIKDGLQVGTTLVLDGSGLLQDAALPNVVTPGTYNNITVDSKGRATAGSNVAYLTTESDTLATVTARGATTSVALSVTNATPSTSTVTGALVLTGGLGVGGDIWATSMQGTPIGNTTRSSGAFTSLASNGAVTHTGGTSSTNTTTGQVVVTGGVGISENLNIGGNLHIVGIPTAPTAAAGTNTTQLATTAFANTLGIDINRFGFLNQTETTISFDHGTDTFTLAPVGLTWSYYRSGLRYIITGSKTVVLPAATATTTKYFIYIDAADGTLTQSLVPWTLNDTKVLVAIVVRNSTTTPNYLIGEERHSCIIDRRTHLYNHSTAGTLFSSGAVLTGPVVGSSVDADKTVAVTAANIFDEDIFQSTLPVPLGDGVLDDFYSIVYRVSATDWKWERSIVPFKYTGVGAIEYDNAGTMTPATAGLAGNTRWVNYYLCCTNVAGQESISWIPGRAEFTSLALANSETFTSFSLVGLPVAELVSVYRFTWETSGSNLGLCQLAQMPVRISSNIINSTSVSVGTHNTLAGIQGGLVPNEFYHLTLSEYSGTGTGTFVRADTPSLITPILGTPTSGNLANCTFPTLNQDTTGTADKAYNLKGGNNTTLLGSVPYQSNVDTTLFVIPNTTATKKFFNQTGDGANGAVPSWDALTLGDLPLITPASGGTGVANGSNNTLTFTGNYSLGITLSNNTSVTFPTSGTLINSTDTAAKATVLATPRAINGVDFDGSSPITINAEDATARIAVADKDASGGVPGLTLFKINIRNAANTITNFFTNATTAIRTWKFPDKDGTVAMTSDLGAIGGGTDKIFFENGQTVNSNYTITTGNNAGTFGPVTIADGVTVTIPDGSVWTIV